MNNLKQSILNGYDYNTPLSTHKTVFWDNFGCLTTPKYRNIPVSKTTDAIKVTGIPIEDVSGVKELENVNHCNRNNTPTETTKSSSSSSNTHSKRLKHSPNVAPREPSNTDQYQTDPAPSSLDRQSSWSEPTLASTKDRGDSAVFQDVCEEEMCTLEDDSERSLGDGKSLLPKKPIVKGLLYIKNGGEIYKSEIEAEQLQVNERDIFKNFPGFRRSTSKNLPEKNAQMKQIQADGMGDFNIAIYLSGLVSAVQTHEKQNMKDFERTQQEKIKDQSNRIKKKRIAANPPKSQIAKKCDASASSRCKTRLTYQINRPNTGLDLSADDSNEEYELNESGTIVSKRRAQETLDNNSSEVRHAGKPSDSGRLSCKSRKSGTSAVSSRTKMMSQSSLYRCGGDYGFQKPKINEDEMWETFEMIFKSYASTSRHSGEVIPRKISTDWMINAGIVNGLMTQKKADDAFRNAAGAKITMNAQEYKEFLISLSLKLKLSYYEIYRRMCGM